MNALAVVKYGTKAAMWFGCDKVVTEAVKLVTPDNASRATKIMMRVGGLGLSTAVWSIVSKEIDDTVNTVVNFREEYQKKMFEMQAMQEMRENIERTGN